MGGARGCDERNGKGATDRSSPGTLAVIRTKSARPSKEAASCTSPAFAMIRQTTSSKSAPSQTPRAHDGSGGLAYASKDRPLMRTQSKSARAAGPTWRRRIRTSLRLKLLRLKLDEVKYFFSSLSYRCNLHRLSRRRPRTFVLTLPALPWGSSPVPSTAWCPIHSRRQHRADALGGNAGLHCGTGGGDCVTHLGVPTSGVRLGVRGNESSVAVSSSREPEGLRHALDEVG